MHNTIEVDLATIDPLEELQMDLDVAEKHSGQKPQRIEIGKVDLNKLKKLNEKKNNDDANANNNSDSESDSEEEPDMVEVHGYAVAVNGQPQVVSQYGIMEKDGKKKIVLINDPNTWNFD